MRLEHAAASVSLSSHERTLLDRALSLFAPVKAGEGVGAVLLALNVFLLLASYYVLKTVRESLILTQGGAEIKSYSAAGQALLLLLIVPAYGALASAVNRIRLISFVTLFFASHLLVFSALGFNGFRVGIAFFLWVGIFNLLVIAQFWAFANDIYTEEQGKRLFALVGVGSSLGAWAGASLATRLFHRLGPYELMLLAAGILAACVVVSLIVHRRASNGVKSGEAQKPLGREGGFQLVWKDRYLLLIAGLILVLNVVNSTGEFLLGKLVVAAANQAIGRMAESESLRQAFIGQFYGNFFSWVNLLGLLIQLFLVSRIFKYIGVRGALFILPCIALAGYAVLLAVPILSAVRITKVMENSTDYSIQNTARHALFLPTSREAKYKAKAAIDTFFWRAGDMLQAVVVFVGTSLAFGVPQFAMLNVAFVVVWLLVSALIYGEHKRLTATSDSEGRGLKKTAASS